MDGMSIFSVVLLQVAFNILCTISTTVSYYFDRSFMLLNAKPINI